MTTPLHCSSLSGFAAHQVSMKRFSRPETITTVLRGSFDSESSRLVMYGEGVASCGTDCSCVSVPS